MISRINVSKNELEKLIIAELAQHEECLGMPFLGICKLSNADDSGCNWRELGFNTDNIHPSALHKAITVINDTKQKFNLK